MPDPLLVLLVLVVLIVAVGISLILGRRKPMEAEAAGKRSDTEAGDGRHCPLCAANLKPGQTLRSKVIEVSSPGKFQAPVKESISHVFGCPWCYPANRTFVRVCPVCKEELASADYVIARYFEKSNARNHLHVIGCTRCRKF